MKHRSVLVAFALFFQLAAVPLTDAAFKIPGLPMAGGQSAVPGGGRGPAGGAAGGHRHAQGGNGGEYMGPVFIIRELDKDAELYDAFITTGGIQEAKPPAPGKAGQAGQQLKSGRPVADEDSEYVGVMVTPETVRQIRFAKGVVVNASLSMLLNAASSRMPWLLVLRRDSHFELSAGGDKGPAQPTPAPQQPAADQLGGISPNLMQVPQRRRYYGPGLDARQRRSVDFRFGRPLPAAAVADPEVTRSVPLMLEREMMSTMCFNFAREFYQTSTTAAPAYGYPYWGDDREQQQQRTGHRDTRPNVDAYAAAAARYDTPSPELEPQPQEPAVTAAGAVPMAVPKRVS